MIYEIVLIDGTVLKCWAKNIDEILEMVLRDDIFVVQENGYPDKTTYIMPDRVSHYRFPKNMNGVAEPRK
ncbi:hypothetical protein [Bacillus smithii]|uniref:hypothetical protein n=1 Tax=Bacillus smithii TaxID=1479 RepID=UPI003D210C26